MSAESRRVTDTEIWTPEVWTQRENQVVNGAFPMRRLLGCSNHSAVFLTEYKAKNLPDAAIKFVRADAQAKARLAQWEAAIALSHPHLVRLFEAGQCQLGGHEFLFVVMEYAEQTLAQILAQRALSPDEVRELLLPTLDALAFLHRNHRVHGQLKPSNLLAVNDELKLASDTVLTAGHSATGIARVSSYDPPELKDRGSSTAGDVWSLGMTLVEALTQRTTAWPDRELETISLPPNFPAPFVATVRRCLSLTPAHRPTAIELDAEYKPAPPAHSISNPRPADPRPAAPAPAAPPPAEPRLAEPRLAEPRLAEPRLAEPRLAEPRPAAPPPAPRPPAHETPRAASAPLNLLQRYPSLLGIAAAILVSLAVFAVLHFSGPPQADLQPPAAAPAAPTPAPEPEPVAPSAIVEIPESNSSVSSPVALPPDQSSLPPPAATSLSALHEVTPNVPQSIREKIQGRVRVTVRVLVDPAGDVFGALMENPGPSKYFARLADNAAREWKFAPADNQNARVWLLRFEFTRDGVTARATATQ